MSTQDLQRIREIALALPEVTERSSHGAPSFYFRGKRPICYFHDSEFSSDGRISVWCPAPPGGQEELIAVDATVFFAPTPSASGVFGNWVAAFLDDLNGSRASWDDIAEMIEDAFRLVAPKKLIAEMDATRES
ncbi:MAG: MmcQ/YjbR family DNA-binding protein [Acidimicrobiales bacterium]